MRQGAAEQIASEAARAAARAELNSVKNLLEYQMLAPTIGGAGSHLRTSLGRKFPDIREFTGKIQSHLCLNGHRNGIIALDSEG